MNRPTKAKARNFAFILYPESLPDNWKELLESLDIPMAISPLHDKDVREISEADMTPEELATVKNGGKLYKKPHYHVLYINPNPVTVDSVRKKIQRKLGEKTISHVEIVDGVKSYYDYLSHHSKDAIAKNKHEYDPGSIIRLNNFDIDRYIVLDEAQKADVLNMLLTIIKKEKLENMIDLEDFVEENREAYDLPSDRDLRSIYKANTGLLRLYFDGVYQRAQRNAKIEELRSLEN